MTEKKDFKKHLDAYRATQGSFRVTEVPETSYLMIDGHGDPNQSTEFTAAVEALYPVAYRLKFASRRDLGLDYVVMPLEGLWSAPDLSVYTAARDKSRWDWTLMIMVPHWTTAEMFSASLGQLGGRRRPARLDDVRLESLTEGTCVQTLHVGSFDDEAGVLARMHDDFIPEHGYQMVGRHHEIYLSDLRRVAPEKQRTILRQPVTRAP